MCNSFAKRELKHFNASKNAPSAVVFNLKNQKFNASTKISKIQVYVFWNTDIRLSIKLSIALFRVDFFNQIPATAKIVIKEIIFLKF